MIFLRKITTIYRKKVAATFLTFLYAIGGGVVFAANIEAVLDDAAGASAWSIQDSATAEKVRVNSLGNVGIGTTTPQDKLIVLGGNVGIGTWTATERMIIQGGNLGIGTTSAPQSLYVAGTAEAQGFKLNQNAVAGYVLTSSSVGVGTWMAAGTLASGSVASGTINQVAKYAATGAVVSGSSILFDDATNVGIGTSTPQTLFSVVGGNVGIGTWTATERMIIQGGNLGIGTTSAPQSLYVAGTAEAQGFKLNQNAVAGYVLTSSSVGVGTWMAVSTLGAGGTAAGGLNAVEYNSPVGTFAGTENVFSFNGTNVGIGTTNGVNLLDVRGDTSVTSGNVGIGTTIPQGALTVMSGNVGIGTWVPGNLFQMVNNDSQTILTSIGGMVAYKNVNTTNNTGVKFVFQTNDTDGALAVGARVAGIFTSHAAGAVSGDLVIETTNAGTSAEKLRITSAGNVGIGTNTPQGALTVMNGNVGIGTWKPNNLMNLVLTDSTISPTIDAIGTANMGLQNLSTTDNTWALFALQTVNSLGVLVRGARVGSIFTDHTSGSVDADFAVDTVLASTSLERFRIKNSGNIGMGTFGPTALLHVVQTAASDAFRVNDVAGDTSPFLIDQSGNVGIGTTLTTTGVLTVMSGNVGIGTWVPGGGLHVKGEFPVMLVERVTGAIAGIVVATQIRTTSTGSAADEFGGTIAFELNDDETAGLNVIGRIGAVRDGSDTSGAMVLHTSSAGTGAEKMRITATGNVGIATFAPNAFLDISSTTNQDLFRVNDNGT
ncbi:MAG: hypothetical protein Q7K71_07820, partial [Candidatus Omnitrophota bacterium]|nr:hypothetical protein [Candidatus Omnitrophota bacterium]